MTKTVAAFGALLLVLLFGTASQSAPEPVPSAGTPCGFVDFVPAGAPRSSNGTTFETIKATVTFPDGHRESAQFPYPWIYSNGEETDPWSSTNLRRADVTVALQMPPRGADSKTFPPLIRYILEHTTPAGLTKLVECNGVRAASEPAFPAPALTPVSRNPVWLPFIDDSPPDSPIKIVDAAMWTSRAGGPGLATVVRDCVTFWNRSPKVVVAIQFSFTHFDAAGALKLIQPFDRTGSFAPGALVEGPRRAEPLNRTESVALKNCRTFVWSGDAGVNRVAVSSVVFGDDSTWTPGPRTASPAPRR